MRILVTGGAGFIGSAFVRAALAQGAHVCTLDKLTYAGRLSNLEEVSDHPRRQFVRGDINDAHLVADVLRSFAPDSIVNFAAETHVDRSITDAAAFVHTNVQGVHTLLDAALRFWERLPETAARARFRFLQVSTDEVFGALGPIGAFTEAAPYAPRSPYAASKAAGDHLVRAWRHTYDLPAMIAISSNNYGPRQFPEKFIPMAIINAIEEEPIGLYGDGAQIRDWIHVDDHVTALLEILQRGELGQSYLVGARNERKNIDVAAAICDIVDELCPRSGQGARRRLIALVPDRPGHDRRYAVDCAKLERTLGWRAAVGFEQGLRQTVAWYLAHRDCWAPVKGVASKRLGMRAVAE